jgi:hypothetical protein
LKACGVVTGAAGKRNPFMRENRSSARSARTALQLKSRQQSIAAVLPLQFIHQVPEVGRQFGIFRAKILPQPLADATAYRSAGGTIDLFAALVDSVHRRFHFALVACRCHRTKSPARKLFRSRMNCMPLS